MLHKDKEVQYATLIQQICTFIEHTINNNGQGKQQPPNDQAIQSKFSIDPADYTDVMNEVYSQYMHNRVADGTGIFDNPPPGQDKKQPDFVPTSDHGDPPGPSNDNGNPNPGPQPKFKSELPVSDTTGDATQTPDYVPPAIPVPESNPSN